MPEEVVAQRIADRAPSITGAEIADELVPPRQFATASFESYRPDPDFPSQAEAVDVLRSFASPPQPVSRGFFGRRKRDQETENKPGVYLDGGFGVGKTHLLAAAWHATSGRKFFGTFIEFTALVGALGYQGAVALLRGSTLVCIDEFELDDPGDTMMMTRLLSELVAHGTRVAATSNTPPNSLGEGRFAAQDFLREIQALSGHFRTVRIDGNDYRHRGVNGTARMLEADEVVAAVSRVNGGGGLATLDSFPELLQHLSSVHPSRYIKMIDGIDLVGITDITELHSQTDALRLVAFIDRVYDAQIPLAASGFPLEKVFAPDMLQGGYRKKYLRCVSRLIALTEQAAD